MFQKIILIGSGGSGKSILARKIAGILELPVHHLDQMYWKPNWVATPKEEWRKLQDEVCSQSAWIIDGNYGGTMDIRLRACDTIVFLDLPRWLCVFRALKRSLIYRGKSRPDMAEGCEERMNREFFQWIWDYPRTKRPCILEKLERIKNEKSVFILKSRSEVDQFLPAIKEKQKVNRSVLTTP